MEQIQIYYHPEKNKHHFAYIYKSPKSEEIIKKLEIWKANENLLDLYNKKPNDYDNDYNSKKKLNKNKSYNNCINKKNSSSILNDSLDDNNNNNINNKNAIKFGKNMIINSRNKAKKIINILTEKSKTNFNYPKLFNNIINNNLRTKQWDNIYNNLNNNKSEEKILRQIISKKRLSIASLKKNKKNSSFNNNYNTPNIPFTSAFSTEEYTKNKEKIIMIKNKEVVEFNYEDKESSTEGNNCCNGINNNIISNTNNTIIIDNTINTNNTSFNVLNHETLNRNENILFSKKKICN